MIDKQFLPPWVTQRAYFTSPDYRVWLSRRFEGIGPPLGFILYNPSTAGHDRDDPTLRRGIGFAKAVGASGVVFVNLFTGTATDADDLERLEDPVGRLANYSIRVAASVCGGRLVAAWGGLKGTSRIKRLAHIRGHHVKRLCQREGIYLDVLRVTAKGHPEHPLYLPGDLRPRPWSEIVEEYPF